MESQSNPVKVAKVDRLSSTKVRLTVEISDQMIKSSEKAIINRIKSKANLPGFRKGKVPDPIVRKKYEAEIKQDLINNLLETGLMNAVQETKLYPLDQPKIDLKDVSLEKEAKFTFDAEYEVHPEIELKQYKDLMIEKSKATVEDKMVDDQINRLRDSWSNLVPSKAEKPEKGLFAQLEIGVDVLKTDPPKSEPVKPFTVELGANQLIPELETGILSLKLGEERDIEAKFPEDYGDKEFAGKDAVFHTKLLELKKKELPELNDDFASQVKPEATLLSLRADIRSELEKESEAQVQEGLRSQVIEQLIEKNPFDIPESMIQKSENSLKQSVLQQRNGGQPHQHTESCNHENDFSKEELDMIHNRAKQQVHSSLILGKVAEMEKIGVDQSKVTERVKDIAERLNRPVEEAEKMLSGKGMMDKLKDEILTDAVFDFLIQNAKVKEK